MLIKRALQSQADIIVLFQWKGAIICEILYEIIMMVHDHHIHADKCHWHTHKLRHNVSLRTHAHFAHSVRVWEFSIPERLRCRLKRMSSHTEGSPHEIESHVARFQPDYRVGQSTHHDLRNGSRERNTPVSPFKTGRLARAVTVCCYDRLLLQRNAVCVLRLRITSRWFYLIYFSNITKYPN